MVKKSQDPNVQSALSNINEDITNKKLKGKSKDNLIKQREAELGFAGDTKSAKYAVNISKINKELEVLGANGNVVKSRSFKCKKRIRSI